jgi:hypothetical protein
MSNALTDAQTKLDDPSLKDQISKLEEENKQLKIASSKVEASVQTIIASTAPLVEKAQAVVSTTPKWDVVFSGDSALDPAKYEIEVAAPKFGIPNASIYLRQGSYRSVSVVEDRLRPSKYFSEPRRGALTLILLTWLLGALLQLRNLAIKSV